MNRCFQFPDGFLVSIYHQISNYHKILPSDKVVPSLNVKIQHIFSFISSQTPLTEDFISVLQNHLHLHFYSARVWSKQLRIVILLVTATGPRLLTCVCVSCWMCAAGTSLRAGCLKWVRCRHHSKLLQMIFHLHPRRWRRSLNSRTLQVSRDVQSALGLRLRVWTCESLRRKVRY